MTDVLVASTLLLWLGVIANFLLTLALVRKVARSHSRREQSGPRAGDRIPEFSAMSLTGSEFGAIDFAGPAIFMFVSGHCRPCLEAMPTYKQVCELGQQSNVRVVVVSGDTEEDARKMVERFEFTGLVLIAPRDSNPMFDDWKVVGTPAYVATSGGLVVESGIAQKQFANWTALVNRLAADWRTPVSPARLVRA